MTSRVLLKLSGEALAGQSNFNHEFILKMSQDIVAAVQHGQEIGIVVGGGNIMRGSTDESGYLDRVTADQMGMLATMINALSLRDALRSLNVKVELMSAFAISGLFPPVDPILAKQLLSEKTIVIFAAGTGNPFVTTDSAASLRAMEIEADILLKATKVDGIYSQDPKKNPEADIYTFLSFDEVITKKLAVMDLGAFEQCREHNIPIRVFNLFAPGILRDALLGKAVGTLVAQHSL
jgi:uridylate kinase